VTNVGDTVTGSCRIGGVSMSLVNKAQGVIDAAGSYALNLYAPGAKQTITNAGLIDPTGSGGAVVDSAVKNTGTLETDGGSLALDAAVTGSGGKAVIAAGTLTFASTFKEAVDFTGTSGQLVLARSLTTTGHVSGSSPSGGASLDLKDVSFVSPGRGDVRRYEEGRRAYRRRRVAHRSDQAVGRLSGPHPHGRPAVFGQ
jgi:hypothetical protein